MKLINYLMLHTGLRIEHLKEFQIFFYDYKQFRLRSVPQLPSVQGVHCTSTPNQCSIYVYRSPNRYVKNFKIIFKL